MVENGIKRIRLGLTCKHYKSRKFESLNRSFWFSRMNPVPIKDITRNVGIYFPILNTCIYIYRRLQHFVTILNPYVDVSVC